MNTVFFGKEGITMTSANHLCNLAKERIEALSAECQREALQRFLFQGGWKGGNPLPSDQLRLRHREGLHLF